MDTFVHPDFEPLNAAFQRNLDEGRELGAALVVYRHGQLVLDVWGGQATPDGDAWEPGTMACMMSVAKGITGLCMAMLYDRGQLDLEAPVARYWPEFTENGKADITVTTALSHRAGIPAFDAAKPGDIYDWTKMVTGLAAQTPYWPPGSMLFYHSATLGFIAGEILRRIDGRTIGAFVREEIAEPLGADYFFGLTDAESACCATMVASPNNVVNAAKAPDAPEMQRLQWQSLPAEEDYNSPQWRAAQIPSVNGYGTARGVAKIYAALAQGGALDGVRLLRQESLGPFLVERGSGTSESSGLDLRSGLCFMLSSNSRPMGGPRGFGHSGAGGAQSFADPDSGIGICYCPNKMHDGSDVGLRVTRILDALDACTR
ncbi:MAG: serine hydrolase domain-containing protein [Alphaproteobacteria bacterium]|jgi:CubicO group peptidase (beta-lactamase class C family)